MEIVYCIKSERYKCTLRGELLHMNSELDLGIVLIIPLLSPISTYIVIYYVLKNPFTNRSIGHIRNKK